MNRRSTLKSVVVTALACQALAACEAPEEATGEGAPGAVSVAVAPLTLTGVTNACYTLTVRNALGEVVFTRPGVCSDQFGSGQGDIAFVGTCDADNNSNVVELSVDGLFDADGQAIADIDDPCAGGVCARTFDCIENGDTQVDFNLTVLRDLGAGFVDVSVNFDEIFCSAKVDCASQLLVDPQSNQHVQTVILGLACTAGPGSETHLYRNPVVIECADGQVFPFDPSANGPAAGPVATQAAYVGAQGSADAATNGIVFWNVALGLSPNGLPADCVLRTTATASEGGLADALTPANYPIVIANVPLTDANGALICDKARLDDAGGTLSTVYAPQPTKFAYELLP